MITSCEFRRYHETVQRSGVAPLLRERLRTWKHDEDDDRNYGGRRAGFSVELFLAGLLANAGLHRPMFHKGIHRLLTRELERPTQVSFKIINRRKVPGTGVNCPVRYQYGVITVRQVLAMMARIEDVLEPLDGAIPDKQQGTARTPAGEMPGIVEAIATLKDAGPYSDDDSDAVLLARWAVNAENLVRDAVAQQVMDMILDAAVPATPGFATGSYAVDETSVEAWALPSRDKKDDPNRLPSADPAAHWGHRSPTNYDEREMVFGYAATAMVRVPDVGHLGLFPVLCERLVLRPASKGGVPAAMVALDSLRGKGSATVKELLADILYSQSVPENWVDPLRERKIVPTFDLHPNDRGPRYDPVLGVLWVDGWPHCPNMPQELMDLAKPRNLCPAPEPEPVKEDPKQPAREYPAPPPTKRRKASKASKASAEAARVRREEQARLDRDLLAKFVDA